MINDRRWGVIGGKQQVRVQKRCEVRLRDGGERKAER